MHGMQNQDRDHARDILGRCDSDGCFVHVLVLGRYWVETKLLRVPGRMFCSQFFFSFMTADDFDLVELDPTLT